MKSTYCLVYQAGIANVFEEFPRETPRYAQESTGNKTESERIRVLQSDFRTCEDFCRGLRQAKQTVRVAWCNEAGDIKGSIWHFFNFDNAPFSESFASDFVSKES